jgi:hypothetical protein
MPIRRPIPLSIALPGVVCAFVLKAAFGAAQVPGDLPSAPDPQTAALSVEGEQALRVSIAPMAGAPMVG